MICTNPQTSKDGYQTNIFDIRLYFDVSVILFLPLSLGKYGNSVYVFGGPYLPFINFFPDAICISSSGNFFFNTCVESNNNSLFTARVCLTITFVIL